MDEIKALRGIRRGNEQALMWVIQRYTPYVGTIVHNIVGTVMTVGDVEEVTSDVFLSLWQSAGKVQPGKLKSWLGTVARNKAKQRLRQAQIELPLEDDVLHLTADPTAAVETRELVEQVTQAVLEMDAPDREIFLRHYYYYQPLAEIAEELGMNLSTVKTRLRRGRMKLKEQLEEGGCDIEDQDF